LPQSNALRNLLYSVFRDELLDVLDEFREVTFRRLGAARGNFNHLVPDLFDAYTERPSFEINMQGVSAVAGGVGYTSNEPPVEGIGFETSDFSVWSNPYSEGIFLVRLDCFNPLDRTFLGPFCPKNNRWIQVRQYLTCTFPSHLKSPASTNPLKTRFIGDME
jgi:hypothetical protein